MSIAPTTPASGKSHLRLVSSSGDDHLRSRTTPTQHHDQPLRARHLAQLDSEARQLRAGVLRAALASGYAINPDAVSAIFAAKASHTGPLRYFTEDTVWDLIWFDISHWCGTRGLDLPAGMHRALWFVLGHLAEADELHPHSDPLDDLRAPLFSSAGLDHDGGPRFRY